MSPHALYLLLAVGFNVGAYAVFRAIAERPHDWRWAALFGAGLALGGVNTLCFTLAMRRIPLTRPARSPACTPSTTSGRPSIRASARWA